MMLRHPVPHRDGQLYNLAEARVHGHEPAYSTSASTDLTSSGCGSTSSVSIASSDVSEQCGTTGSTASSVPTPVPSQSMLDVMEANCSPTLHLQIAPKVSEFLDEGDVIASKHILAKLCQAVVENTCHHARKVQGLDDDRLMLQEAINNAVAVLGEDLDITKTTLSESFVKKLDTLDEQMNALEAVAGVFKELDIIETILNSMGPVIETELDTVDLMKKNLNMQDRLIAELEARSIKHKTVSEALDYGNPKMLRNALREEVRHYGTGETEYSIPSILAEMTSFQRDLDVTRRFYENCLGLPVVDFTYINNLIEEVKEDLSEDIATVTRDENYGDCGAFALSPVSSGFTERVDSLTSIDSQSVLSSTKALEGALPSIVSPVSPISGMSSETEAISTEVSTSSLPESNSVSNETSLTDVFPAKLSQTASLFAKFEDYVAHVPLSEKTALSSSLHTACSLVDTSVNNTESSTIAI
uniref:VOC domain-containing protein n=1 Tax=Panagrellus redivivus TaxID=6233 RepID=A0A7E4V585_PANRE